ILVLPWTTPLREARVLVDRCCTSAIESGENQFASYGRSFRLAQEFRMGCPLPELASKAAEARTLGELVGNRMAIDIAEANLVVAALLGTPTVLGPWRASLEEELVRGWQSRLSIQALITYRVGRATLHAFFGEWEQASRLMVQTRADGVYDKMSSELAT